MYQPCTYLVDTYFPIYLPIDETYFLQNWLPRGVQILTQMSFTHNWVIMGIQWMVRCWLLVPCGHLQQPALLRLKRPKLNNCNDLNVTWSPMQVWQCMEYFMYQSGPGASDLAKMKYQSNFGTREFSKSKSHSGIPNAFTRSWWCSGINNDIFIVVPDGICNDQWYQHWFFKISSFNNASSIVLRRREFKHNMRWKIKHYF
jgi:hypothetical protein